MAFVSYAVLDDLEQYAPGMAAAFWENDKTKAESSLARTSRKVNEWLRGLDRFDTDEVPIAAESDGSYAEVLIELTVYMTVWTKVRGTLAGEAFEEHWRWLPDGIRSIKSDIAKGAYTFGTDGDKASAGSAFITLRRGSL